MGDHSLVVDVEPACGASVEAGTGGSGVRRGEWAWALCASSLLALAAFLPYLVAYVTTPVDRVYLGFALNAKDQNTYFMWMSQAASGDVFLRNLYTSTPHAGAMLNLFFLAAALPARLGLAGLDACYQAARLASSLAMGLSAYGFAALFFSDARRRRMAWATVVFTAGFGWLASAVSFAVRGAAAVTAEGMMDKPVDAWVPEAFPWFSALVMPHFAMAIALLLLTFRLMVRGLEEDSARSSACAGICLFALSFVHPYDVLVLFAVGGATFVLLWRKKGWQLGDVRHPALWYAFGVPPVLYNYWILNSNPGMREWLVQNVSFSPPPWGYVAGFGIPLAAAAFWLVRGLRSGGDWGVARLAVGCWVALSPILLYVPLPFQRRLAIGLSAPLALALADALWGGWGGVARRRSGFRPWASALLAVACLTGAFHYANAFRKIADRGGENYADRALVEALADIGRTGSRRDVLLCGFETGNLAPRFTGAPVVVGSRGQTGDFDRTLADVKAFFGGGMSAEKMGAFLSRKRVGVVLAGPEETGLGAGAEWEKKMALLGWVVRSRWGADQRFTAWRKVG